MRVVVSDVSDSESSIVINCVSDCTVLDLKSQIQCKHIFRPVDKLQNLVYNGRCLRDDEKVNQISQAEELKLFLVISSHHFAAPLFPEDQNNDPTNDEFYLKLARLQLQYGLGQVILWQQFVKDQKKILKDYSETQKMMGDIKRIIQRMFPFTLDQFVRMVGLFALKILIILLIVPFNKAIELIGALIVFYLFAYLLGKYREFQQRREEVVEQNQEEEVREELAVPLYRRIVDLVVLFIFSFIPGEMPRFNE